MTDQRILKAAKAHPSTVKYIESKTNKPIDWNYVIEVGLDSLKTKVDHQLNSMKLQSGLGGEPIPSSQAPTNNNVSMIEEYIRKYRPDNWKEIKEAFKDVEINEALFRGS